MIENTPISAPIAKQQLTKLTKFDHVREDPYFWLNDKTNPDVLAYLAAENKYTAQIMQDTKQLQDKLYQEILSRIKEDDESYPTLKNGYYYFVRTIPNQQYNIYCRQQAKEGSQEEILFDVNKLAEGYDAFVFIGYAVSPNNQYIAYLYNTTGSYAEFNLKIINLQTREAIGTELSQISSIAWANDNKTLFYTKIDATLRPYALYRQDIFTEHAELLYEEQDAKFNIDIDKCKNKQYLILNTSSKNTSEEWLLDANTPYANFSCFIPRQTDVEYTVYPHAKGFYLYYKDKQQLNGKIYLLPTNNYQVVETWQEIVAHNTNIFIVGLDVLQDYLLLQQRVDGLNQIKILDLVGTEIQQITFNEPVYLASLIGNPEYNSTTFRYNYSSLNQPAVLYEYDIKTNQTVKLKQQEIPCGFVTENYQVERLWAKANDGVQVPIALVYKKGIKLDGSAPTLLYGYGSYGHSTQANFRSAFYSLIDRGFVFALAQIRGGSELGEEWYQQGKLLKKKNTFNDFIACSEELIKQQYTSAGNISIMGGSAGGLLIGAVINMRPELYKTAVAAVPFVDVVTTMLDDNLPLTVGEYEEWGNPNEQEFYNYMVSYSPYDNVKAQSYPNLLVTSGINDSQVLFHEPTKWVAKLRSMKTDQNYLLLHMNMESGHGGATGRYDSLKELAFELAFILKTYSINS